MAEWNSINHSVPEKDAFVLVSIKEGNSYYHEVMEYDYDKRIWKYRSGKDLKNGCQVVGWKECGSTYLG